MSRICELLGRYALTAWGITDPHLCIHSQLPVGGCGFRKKICVPKGIYRSAFPEMTNEYLQFLGRSTEGLQGTCRSHVLALEGLSPHQFETEDQTRPETEDLAQYIEHT